MISPGHKKTVIKDEKNHLGLEPFDSVPACHFATVLPIGLRRDVIRGQTYKSPKFTWIDLSNLGDLYVCPRITVSLST